MSPMALKDILSTVTSGILEKSAFLFAEPEDAPSTRETWPEEVLAVDLVFRAQKKARLRIASVPQVGMRLAEEILGTDPGDPEARRDSEDALGEVTNMTAGKLVTRLFGPDGTWELGLPRVRTLAAGDYLEERKNVVACVLLLDEDSRPIEICLFEEGEASP